MGHAGAMLCAYRHLARSSGRLPRNGTRRGVPGGTYTSYPTATTGGARGL
jgi:hypothetical protein